MKNREYHVGPGAVSLLLIIVVVSMSVLGLLSLISARGDLKLTERAIAFSVGEFGASAEAERSLAALDEVLYECARNYENDEEYISAVADMLPDGMEIEERIVKWTEKGDAGRELVCAVLINPLDSKIRFTWVRHTFEANVNEDGYNRQNFDAWE